ncbi:hypothetical protein [Nocardia salmonicida]|uniref:hypothetical protein n=1 Tax=Nocardia salmonicida TaxID=53431 RepID=UPI002E2C9001|nr:hypothetical protein [Nocardia salmonicida]
MTDLVIEVTVPDSADIVAEAEAVDIVTDSSGAQVIVVATPGPPGPPGEISPEDLDDVVDDVIDELEPPVSLTQLFLNGMA